jgi:PAS domain S-box-containing protein
MGKYLGCNTAFENFTGIPRNEMIGKNVFEVYPQDLADTYYNSDSKMFKQKEKHFYDSYYPRADGSKRNVMIQKAPFLKPDGSLGGIIGSVIDITDRKQMEEKLESLVNIRTTKLTKAIEQLQREMQERQHAEEKLIASEKKYRNIFENTIAGIAQTTPEGRFITVNPAGAALLGYASPDELINYTHDIGKQFYVDPNNRKEMIDVLSKSDKYETFETEFYRKDGKIVTLKVVYKGVRNSQGELAYLEGFVEDITEIKQAEDAIRASLNEKEVLLREIYHRTKNNMQVICSLLRLQVNYIKDERITQVLQETESRIYSMALMHEKLYQSKDLSKIDLGIYIKDLANSLMVNYLYGHEKISFHIDVMSVIVSIDTAVPCGLIINELLTNALKYAFPSGAEGNIVVSLSTTSDNEIDLVIADNGIGLPADLDFKKVNSLGLKLVFNLVENQLKGRLEVNNYPGTEYQIRFTDLGKETVGYS